MNDLKRKYNKLLQRVIKYGELPKETQEQYNQQLEDILSEMNEILITLDIDCVEYQGQILNGFEV